MKLVRVIFLFCVLAILLLITPTSSLKLKPHYSSPSQGLNEKIVIKIMASRKLMNIPSEHVMGTTVHDEGSSEQSRVTTYEKFKEENNKLSEEEEEKKALSKYLSMDYPRFRRRRPVHNKSLPLRP